MSYESVDRYLAQLPNGIHSHPDVMVKGSVVQNALEDDPFQGSFSRLPPEVAGLAQRPPPPSAWVPVVHLNTLILAHVDHQRLSVDDFLRFRLEKSRAFFRHPLNRLMLLVASPELVLQGGSSRFNTLYKGVSVVGLPRAKRDWAMTLSYRPGLMADTVLRYYGPAFTAAVEGAGGKNVETTLVDSSPSHGVFRVTWTG